MFRLSKVKVGLKNISYLVAGNILGQLLGFIFTIYIARKLGPAEFGIFNTVGAFVAMFGFITFNGYQKVLIRESLGQIDKLQTNIENIFALKTTLSFFATFSVIASSFFVGYKARIVVFISIYGFTLFFNNVSNILQVVFHCHNQMKYITYSGLVQRLIYIVPTSVCIYLGGGIEFLIVLFTLSTMFDVLINYYFASKYFSFKLNLNKLTKFIFDNRLFKQALVFSFLGVIGYFYSKIDIVMISIFLDQKSVGLYSAGYKLIQPMEMISMMGSVSFFPLTVARFSQDEPVKAQTLFAASFIIAAFMFPVSILITIFSNDIILMLYGAEYEEAHLVLKYLCWVIPLTLVTKPFVVAMQANHHENKIIVPNLLRSACNVILNYLLIIKYGMIGVVYSTIITYVWYFLFVNIGYQYFVLKRAGNII